MIVELAVLKGWNPGHVFVLPEGKEKFFFGRADQCELQVMQQGVSRIHFSVEREGSLFYVVDQGSSNGSFLNGERIQRSVLKLNDIITAGEVSMLFRRANTTAVVPQDTPDRWRQTDQDIVRRFDVGQTVIMSSGKMKQGAEALPVLKKALATVYRVGTIINVDTDLDHMLDAVMNVVVKTFAADRGFLITADQNRSIIETQIMRIEGRERTLEEVPITKTIVQKALRDGLSILSPDIQSDERFVATESAIQGNIRSVICVPLVSQTSVVGAIYLDTIGRQADFTEEDLELLSVLGTQVGAAMEKIRLSHGIERLFLGAIQALAAAIDAKDEYTHGHSERVTEFSVAIAKEAGLGKNEIHTVRLSGLLHDVGKIGIPEEVLLKPGKLTAEEYEIMKRHPVLSGQILDKIGNASHIVCGVKHHHERMDGAGYPDGLRGEAIPLSARIICVADSFDAMTSRRHYRRNLTDGEAIEEIRRCSGTQFDPKVVDAFLRAYQKGLIVSRTAAETRAMAVEPVAEHDTKHIETQRRSGSRSDAVNPASNPPPSPA